jgi:hypothetical protein
MFFEMPGMTLTYEQAMRLGGVDGSICQAVLDSLVEAKFLYRAPGGAYTRVTGHTLPRPEHDHDGSGADDAAS